VTLVEKGKRLNISLYFDYFISALKKKGLMNEKFKSIFIFIFRFRNFKILINFTKLENFSIVVRPTYSTVSGAFHFRGATVKFFVSRVEKTMPKNAVLRFCPK
jgi:hypothetical protein